MAAKGFEGQLWQLIWNSQKVSQRRRRKGKMMFKLLTKQSRVKEEATQKKDETFRATRATPFGCGPFSGHLKFFSCLSVQKKEEKLAEKTCHTYV